MSEMVSGDVSGYGRYTRAPQVVHYDAPDDLEVSGYGRDTSAPLGGNPPVPGGGPVRAAGRVISPRSNAQRIATALPQSQRAWKAAVTGPQVQLPRWLADRRIVLVAWVGGLILITIDERQSGYLLPRPLRLWYASGVFLILAALGTSDVMVPLSNALAIGFTITLAFQYYNNEGQFSPAAKGGAGGQAPGGSSSPGGPGQPSGPPQPFTGTPGFPGGVI